MAVFDKRSEDPGVTPISRPRARWLYERYLAPLEARLARPGHFGPAAWELLGSRLFREAGLIHAHVLPHGWFNLGVLPHLARHKPVVWTLHDPWAVTGHCVYPMGCERWLSGCGDCPDLTVDLPLAHDRTAELWRRKRAIYARTPMHLVVVSRWMERIVQASPLFAGRPLHQIPLGLDPTVFHPVPKPEARRALGLDPERPSLLFRATKRSNRFKGAGHAVDALLRSALPERAQILTVDAVGQCEPLRARFDLVELGWVDDDRRAALAFAAADLFLMPSLAEAFGMMALEAMACGTPAIVFAGTALEDVIDETGGGVVVPSGDVVALAAAIDDMMLDQARRDRIAQTGREVVMREYTFDRYVQRHAELYDAIMAERRLSAAG